MSRQCGRQVRVMNLLSFGARHPDRRDVVRYSVGILDITRALRSADGASGSRGKHQRDNKPEAHCEHQSIRSTEENICYHE